MRPTALLSRIPLATRIAVAIGFGLIVAMIAVLVLFANTIRDYEEREWNKALGTMCEMLHEAVKHAAPPETAPDAPETLREIRDIMDKVAKAFNMMLWLEDDAGNRPVRIGADAIPRLELGESSRMGRLTMRDVDCSTGYCGWVEMPTELAGKQFWIRGYLRDDPAVDSLVTTFLYGLGGIGLLGALLSIPLARRIAVPLRKLEESALRMARGDLSQRVEIRGGDEVGRLGAAFNAMADGITRSFGAIRDLNANISHQLRSPLTRIAMIAELARTGLEQGKTADAALKLQGIQEEIVILDGLIERILRLSRQDLRDRAAQAAGVDLTSMIREHCRRIAPLLEAKDADIILERLDPAEFTGPPEDYDTLVVNLLDNAAKYVTPGGRVRVAVLEGGDHVEFSVRNTCRRFQAEELEAMFEPFRRLDQDAAQGYGLGLTLARGAAERLGAAILPANNLDGLEMRVRLPLRAPGPSPLPGGPV